jgi:histidine ammonia-lyase/phenylalanine ammonia-lyase
MLAHVGHSALGLELDGRSLTIEDVVAVARRGATVALAGGARARMRASERLMRELIAREVPIYGVTTGFGDSAHRQISSAKSAALQQMLLRSLGNGTGPTAPHEVARATMLLRANCLAKGNSGVRVEVVERLLTMLEHDLVPFIPERGSCGASGDLVPLSYVASAVTGEGEVSDGESHRLAAEVFVALGLPPLTLQAKEGLGLVNGTSFTSAFACLAIADARALADLADLQTALASEALRGNRGHFNAFLFDEAKPHAGMVQSARHIRELLAESRLALDSDEIFAAEELDGRGYLQRSRHVQDRYSIRCAPHVTGVLRDTLEWVTRWLEVEINSSDDNPLFDVQGGRAQSGGNFYGGHVGQAMDSLKVALASMCDLLDRQLELLVDEKFNAGLTPNLIPVLDEGDPHAGLYHGMKGLQLCCSAMTAEALHLSAPATIHSRSTEAHNQDKVSMATIAGRDARAIVDLADHVAGAHLLAACQALELRGVAQASPRTRAAFELVRERVPFMNGDRRLHADLEAAVELIRDGSLQALVGA